MVEINHIKRYQRLNALNALKVTNIENIILYWNPLWTVTKNKRHFFQKLNRNFNNWFDIITREL
jgi:hypothetical protein